MNMEKHSRKEWCIIVRAHLSKDIKLVLSFVCQTVSSFKTSVWRIQYNKSSLALLVLCIFHECNPMTLKKINKSQAQMPCCSSET